MHHKSFYLAWVQLLLLEATTFAKLVNVTVDDAGEDPTTHASIQYIGASPGAWNDGSACDDCRAVLDSQKVYNGTWHDATYDHTKPDLDVPQNATFSFTGKH